MKDIVYWVVVSGIASIVIYQYEWEMVPVLCFVWWAVGQIVKNEYEHSVFWKKLNR